MLTSGCCRTSHSEEDRWAYSRCFTELPLSVFTLKTLAGSDASIQTLHSAIRQLSANPTLLSVSSAASLVLGDA